MDSARRHTALARSHHTMALAGEIDIASRAELDQLVAELERSTAQDVQVDLTRVTFIDSSGLGFLLRVRRIAADRGGEVVLAGGISSVALILEVSGFRDLFTIAE